MATPAYAGRDTMLCMNDSVFLGRIPEIGLDCQWFNNSLQIAEGAGIWVKPASTQTYIVKQDLCGIIDYDTVTVAINPTCFEGMDELSTNNEVKLYPNPTSSILNIIDEQNQFQKASIVIRNCLGQVVFTSPFKTQIDLQSLSVGMYFLTVQDRERKQMVKVIKE